MNPRDTSQRGSILFDQRDSFPPPVIIQMHARLSCVFEHFSRLLPVWANGEIWVQPLRLKWWIHVLLLEQNLTLISRICVLWGDSLSWKAPNPSLSEIHVTPLPFWCFPINCLWISWPGELDVLQARLGKPCSIGRSIFADDSCLHVLQTGCIWI